LNIGTGGGEGDQNGESRAIKRMLEGSDKPVVFDVGAQGGGYSEEVLAVTQGSAIIYAFEPRKKDFEILQKTLGKKVTLVQSALGGADGEVELFYPADTSGLSSLHKSSDEFSNSEKVKIQTIDGFCKANGVKNITLLKLDVEGHELACLHGAKMMLPHIQCIQFEFGIRSRDARVYFKDIFDFLVDYKIYRILKDGLEEIGIPDKMAEMLFTTNYLAARKDSFGKPQSDLRGL
jgi:FkbM family methyltransferase